MAGGAAAAPVARAAGGAMGPTCAMVGVLKTILIRDSSENTYDSKRMWSSSVFFSYLAKLGDLAIPRHQLRLPVGGHLGNVQRQRAVTEQWCTLGEVFMYVRCRRAVMEEQCTLGEVFLYAWWQYCNRLSSTTAAVPLHDSSLKGFRNNYFIIMHYQSATHSAPTKNLQ